MNNKIITSEGNVQFQYPDGGIVNVHPSLIYTVFNEDTVSFMLIPLPKSSGLAIMASKAKDLELNGTIYSIDDLPNAIAEAFSDAGAQARAEIVDELPTTGKTNTIYLVPKEEGEGYDEYIYLKDEQRWELIGDTSIEIKEYVKKADFSAYTASTQEVIDFLSGAVDDNASDIQFISGAVDTEISNREAADAVISGAVDTLSTNLANEVQRAISAETELNSNLEAEVSARTEADSVLSSAIDTVVSNLASEVSRAQNAEAELSDKIDAASGDVEDIQAELDVVSASLEAEVSARTEADDAFDARLDEDEKVIGESLNDLNTRMTANEAAVSGKADADSVYTKNEVYTKAEVDEAIDDIDLSNYYTKSEVDASQLAQDNEINAISGDVQTLNEKVETISGESVTSGEVQTQIDNSISGKADKTDIYTYEGTDRIKVTNATGIRRKAIDLNIPIYKGTGTASLSLGAEVGTLQGANQIKGFFSTGIGLGLTTNNSSELATGQYNISNTAGSSTWGNSGNTLFSVGNGDHKGGEHNAFEIRQNGDIYITSGGTAASHMFRLQDQLGGGGSSYTAGDGIDITSDVISVTGKVDTDDFNTYSGSVESRLSEDEEVTAAGINAVNDKFGGLKLMKISQSDYDNLQVKDNNTLYIITD